MTETMKDDLYLAMVMNLTLNVQRGERRLASRLQKPATTNYMPETVLN